MKCLQDVSIQSPLFVILSPLSPSHQISRTSHLPLLEDCSFKFPEPRQLGVDKAVVAGNPTCPCHVAHQKVSEHL